MSATLPTNLSDRALAAFTAALGPDRVLTEGAEFAEFRDPFQPASWDDYAPSAVVLPATTEEVQAVVRIAGEHGVPLWAHGQGRNNGYGGAAPRVRGTVTVSLRRMNRVLEIDEEMGYAVVEPGVSWSELYQAITDGGHRLMLSIPDLGWGSVVGNSLEHGITYLPYGEDFMAPCGMEVVLADGTLLRTGMGAMDGNESWHLYKRGLGPTLDPLFMQSNFGIVTRMGVWLMPMPETVMPVWVKASREEDLVALVDTLRRLRLDRTILGVPGIYNTLVLASAVSRRSDWYDGEGPIPDAVIDRVAAEMGVGRWTLRAGLYGDEAMVDLQYAKVAEAFGRIPGIDVSCHKLAPEDAPALDNAAEHVITGVPSLDWANMSGWYGGEEGGHIGFSPVVPLRGRTAYEMHTRMRGLVQGVGLDYTAGNLVINARSYVNINQMVFDTKDEQQTRGAYDTAKLLVREAAKAGYGEYRAHLDFMDLAAEQYGFGDHAYLRFVEKIKDAVDPQGILAPGKQGIWPAAMRTPR
jgi:4-cresol dehydrogenase (hydroxylating) flavoprotein subunit